MRALGRFVFVMCGLTASFFAVLYSAGPVLTFVADQLQVSAADDRLPFGEPKAATAADASASKAKSADKKNTKLAPGQVTAEVKPTTKTKQAATTKAGEALGVSPAEASTPEATDTPASPLLPTRKPSLPETASPSQDVAANDTPDEMPVTSEQRVTYVKASLRSGPSAGAERITLLDEGTELSVIEQNGDWVKVRDAQTGQTGWVLSDQTTTQQAYAVASDSADEQTSERASSSRSANRDSSSERKPRSVARADPDDRATRARRAPRHGRDYERIVLPDGRVVVARRVYPEAPPPRARRDYGPRYAYEPPRLFLPLFGGW